MAAISRMFGSTPRARLLEALIRLGDTPVTRGELAREAGVYRMSTNRIISELVSEGFLTRMTRGVRPTYRPNLQSTELRLLSSFASALELTELSKPDGGRSPEILELASSQMRRVLSFNQIVSVSGEGARSVRIPASKSSESRVPSAVYTSNSG